ncbi:hypothetical protein Klosneuvirus_2_7 [Klosneuvirus KNV1]|uniref:Uncharacterized protein n=1 Tax=Klosneuvirus KNV1 TaxID=1977640 RepID=A0A1V0SIU0_9VIRU|nr:hypothetical protein Klosneuvirus_2_7 [Klosneuvirus KNV1]
MYYIENKFIDTTYLYENIEAMIYGLNTILSTLYDENKSLISIEKTDKMIIYKVNEHIIVSNLIPYDLKYLPYLVLHKNILSQYPVKDTIPDFFLLNVFTSKKCIINPYNVLINIFNINEELIYQTFILFLNKTIFNNHKTNPLNLTDIFKNFFIDNNNIDHKKYNRLFTYYLSAKEIYPFMIKYDSYISIFDA